MAIRSVRAFLHNETNLPLIKVSDECPHGEWTTRAPDRIDANSTAMMRVAAKVAGAVESRATYRIGDNPASTIYIHWNNPISGSNSYHTNTDAAHYAFCSGQSSGSDPVAHFFLRQAGRFETDFLPSRDGFKFKNEWTNNTPYSIPPLRGSLLDKKYGNANKGLCGGMVLGALDYFAARQEIPQVDTPPAGERDPLFLYLVNRLFDTFSVNSVSLLLKLMDPLYPDTDENVLSTFGLADGRAAVMANQEWPLIRAEIDSGNPSPVCIVTVKSVNPFDLGKCHQVLAYAYEAAGHDVTLYVYDPNSTKMVDNVHMKFTDGDVAHPINVQHNINVPDGPVNCFVRMDGHAKKVTIPTRPRQTAQERQSRRIVLIRDPTKVTSRPVVARGQREFDVGPNCGKSKFDFKVLRQTVSTRFTVDTPYYREPTVSWRICGTPISQGKHRVFVRAEAERIADAPPRPPQPAGVQPAPAGMVAINVTLTGNELVVVNEPEDGNYTLVVDVQARDGTDASSVKSRSTSVDIEGFHEDIKGLKEASAECWKNYLKGFQHAQPKAKAVAAALIAQLRRPGDPLWDPDPDMTAIGVMVALDDPTVADVNKWQVELRPGVSIPGGHFTDDLSVGGHNAHPGGVAHPEDIEKQLREQLGSIPTKFSH